MSDTIQRQIVVESLNVMKDCCELAVGFWDYFAEGQTTNCQTCANFMKTVTIEHSDDPGAWGPSSTWSLEKGRRFPAAPRIQALIMSKSRHKTESDAVKWAIANGYKADRVEKTGGSFRLIQEDGSRFMRKTVRHTRVNDGISALVAVPMPAYRQDNDEAVTVEKSESEKAFDDISVLEMAEVATKQPTPPGKVMRKGVCLEKALAEKLDADEASLKKDMIVPSHVEGFLQEFDGHQHRFNLWIDSTGGFDMSTTDDKFHRHNMSGTVDLTTGKVTIIRVSAELTPGAGSTHTHGVGMASVIAQALIDS